jgi:hypothetical protein
VQTGQQLVATHGSHRPCSPTAASRALFSLCVVHCVLCTICCACR